MDEHGDLIIVDLPNYKMVIFQFANHQDSPAMFASPGQRFFSWRRSSSSTSGSLTSFSGKDKYSLEINDRRSDMKKNAGYIG